MKAFTIWIKALPPLHTKSCNDRGGRVGWLCLRQMPKSGYTDSFVGFHPNSHKIILVIRGYGRQYCMKHNHPKTETKKVEGNSAYYSWGASKQNWEHYFRHNYPEIFNP